MSQFLNVHHEDTLEKNPDLSLPDIHQDIFSKTVQGFWLYLMTDCLVFATLFCTYAVLHSEVFGGPSSKDIFSLSNTFIQTMILLCSSLSCGLAMIYSLKDKLSLSIFFLGITTLLGASFLALEYVEFSHLIQEGNDYTRSAFLSAFFTLVGTHGLHISVGLLWIIVLIGQLIYQGINATTFRRLIVFSMFWHFLDLVWIFIFTFVYLMGIL